MPQPWTVPRLLFYVSRVNAPNRNSVSSPKVDEDPQLIADARTSTHDPFQAPLFEEKADSAPATEDLAATIIRLEEALERARVASESAERRLRFRRDQVDDELAAALAACRRLEEEKLTALGCDRVSDAEVFQADPSSPASALTLIGLREEWESAHRATITELQATHQGRLEAQAHEISQRYFQELQVIAVKNAEAMQLQAQHYQARANEEARRRADEQAIFAENHARVLEALRQELSVRCAEEAALREQISVLTSDLHMIRGETAAAHTRIHELLSSTSWRAARPLRGLGRVLRWLIRR